MKYYAYVFDKEGMTKPVFIAEYACKNEGDALIKASKHPGVKKIVGQQQTGRLNVRVLVNKINPEQS